MNQDDPSAGQSAGPAPSRRSPWLDPRRKRVWAVVLLAVYSLVGFFAVPHLLRSSLVDTVRDASGRTAQLGEIEFNPFTFELDVVAFQIDDRDGTRLAGFERLHVNFELSSLFRWAWTFREISLQAPYVLLERFAPGDSRVTRLLADIEARREPGPPAAGDGSLPRFLVRELSLAQGRVEFRDDVPNDPVMLEFGPATISVQDLNTLPDHLGRQAVEIRLPDDATVRWTGDLELGPLKSSGEFQVVNFDLHRTVAYLKTMLSLQDMQARLSFDTSYRLEEGADGNVAFAFENLRAELTELAVTGLDPATEFLTLSRLALAGGSLHYPEMQARVAELTFEQPRVQGWLDEDGTLSLAGLLASEQAALTATDDAAETSWQMAVDKLRIANGAFSLSDHSTDPPADIQLEEASLTASDVSNRAHAEIPLELNARLASGGTLGFEGQLTVLPEFSAHGSGTASGLALNLAQPYIGQQLNVLLQSGTLSSQFEVQVDGDGAVEASGALSVSDLRIEDTLEQLPLLGWAQLELDRFEASSVDRQLSLSRLEFDQPYARIVIFANRTSNLANLMVEPETQGMPPGNADAADNDSAAEPPAAPFGVVVGGVALRNGSMDFSDLSLPLPFATHIVNLGGTVSTIDSASVTPADLSLEGQVDDYGLARIGGSINLLDPLGSTDVSMEFRNLLMSKLSPYSIEFAGQKIDQGKLDLDLLYRIEKGRLDGQNAIVMSDLVLGEKVDNPDAASLPLALAVALLKDADGVIDIDLPVQGDVNDPEFRIGGVIWQAFMGLVTKIVTAPFRLLGNLIGIDTEDLGKFEFLAGRFDLTPPEREKVTQLQEALVQRPELVVQIPGTFDPEIDRPALQYLRLRSAVLEHIGAPTEDGDEKLEMLDEQIRAALEALFQARFPDTPLESVRAAHTAPAADEPEGPPVLDELAYASDLRDRLLAAESVSDSDLEALASRRAEAIREAFLAGDAFEADRVVVAETEATESEDGEWVPLELGVATD